jgi:hypothetical protein
VVAVCARVCAHVCSRYSKNYPPLYVPRHAWNINPHTLPYNSRAFFEYLTRTIGEAQLPDEQLSLDQTLVDTCAARVEVRALANTLVWRTHCL